LVNEIFFLRSTLAGQMTKEQWAVLKAAKNWYKHLKYTPGNGYFDYCKSFKQLERAVSKLVSKDAKSL